MTNIAAFIKAMMCKDRIEEEERKSSLLDKNPKFKKRLDEYKQKQEELQKEMNRQLWEIQNRAKSS